MWPVLPRHRARNLLGRWIRCRSAPTTSSYKRPKATFVGISVSYWLFNLGSCFHFSDTLPVHKEPSRARRFAIDHKEAPSNRTRTSHLHSARTAGQLFIASLFPNPLLTFRPIAPQMVAMLPPHPMAPNKDSQGRADMG